MSKISGNAYAFTDSPPSSDSVFALDLVPQRFLYIHYTVSGIKNQVFKTGGRKGRKDGRNVRECRDMPDRALYYRCRNGINRE